MGSFGIPNKIQIFKTNQQGSNKDMILDKKKKLGWGAVAYAVNPTGWE